MKRGYFYILAAALLFSSTEVAVKFTGGAFNSIQLNFLRFLIGGAILLPMALKQLKGASYRLTKKDFGIFLLTGLACVVVSMTLYILTVSFVPASVAAILYSSNTFFAILFAALFLREKIPPVIGVALAICLGGVLAIIDPFHFTGSAFGVLVGLGSAITFGLYSVLGKVVTRGKPTSGNVLTCFTFIFGGLELGVLMGLTHIPAIAHTMDSLGLNVFSAIPYFAGINLQTVWMLLVISVLITGIGFACYFLAIDTMSVTLASLVFFIKPVLSPIIAYFVLGEVPPVSEVIGIVLIVAGSVLIFTTNLRAGKGVPEKVKA